MSLASFIVDRVAARAQNTVDLVVPLPEVSEDDAAAEEDRPRYAALWVSTTHEAEAGAQQAFRTTVLVPLSAGDA